MLTVRRAVVAQVGAVKVGIAGHVRVVPGVRPHAYCPLGTAESGGEISSVKNPESRNSGASFDVSSKDLFSPTRKGRRGVVKSQNVPQLSVKQASLGLIVSTKDVQVSTRNLASAMYSQCTIMWIGRTWSQIRGWRAVSASGMQGKASQQTSSFADTGISRPRNLSRADALCRLAVRELGRATSPYHTTS